MKTLEKPIRLEPVLECPEKPQNRYVATEILGKGGKGVVFHGIDKVLNREVAIKKIAGVESADGNEIAKSLPSEAQILAALNHPNIVTVYDVHQNKGDVFIVMELLAGKTLDQLSQFGISELHDLVMQTQEALLAANKAGLLHGDLKPQNIMQTQLNGGRAQYKLLDFDQARVIGRELDYTDQLGTCGSVHFMAPERFEGTATSRASDTYAMGCIYYYMLTGQFPCQGETSVEVMAAHLRGDITPLNELRPDLPAWVGQWIAWMMTRDPNSRPQSPLAISESFQELMQRYSSVPEKLIGFPSQQKPTQNEQWYVARGNQVGGPHTWEAVQGFIQRGELVGDDMVKSTAMPEWARIDEVSKTSLKNAG